MSIKDIDREAVDRTIEVVSSVDEVINSSYELMDNNDEFVQYCIDNEIVRIYKGTNVGSIVYPSIDFEQEDLEIYEDKFSIH